MSHFVLKIKYQQLKIRSSSTVKRKTQSRYITLVRLLKTLVFYGSFTLEIVRISYQITSVSTAEGKLHRLLLIFFGEQKIAA